MEHRPITMPLEEKMSTVFATCTQLKEWGIITDQNTIQCCPYCHKHNGESHEDEEDIPEEDVLTYILTPKNRLIGFCCLVYDYTNVNESSTSANAWLDQAIDALPK